MRSALRSLVVLGLVLVLAACRSTPPEVRPTGQEVIIHPTHQHSKYCGHYRFGQRWFYVGQHRHGVHCGHEFVDGAWTLPIG